MKKTFILVVIFAVIISLIGCNNTAKTDEADVASPTPALAENGEENEQILEAWEWQHDLPENHGLNGTVLETLHTELDPTQVFASVVIKDGYIVDEYYKDGYDETSVFALHSCSKSITSALIGIAIDKGYIESVNVPISEYFPQIEQSGNQSLKQITIWHLLTHTSGLSISDDEIWQQWRSSDNWVDYVLNRPITSEPGTTFSYSTGGTHLLSAILQKATGKTAYDFGKEYLFDPIGINSVQCGTDPQGISDGGNGFSMNVYDMAKFGQLFLNSGVWEGQQIIPVEWVEDSTSLQFERSSGSADYGYQWWVRTFGQQRYEAYFAQGHGGQYIFVVPPLDLVVVFTSNHTGSSSMYWQFVTDIVEACEE